MMKLMENEMTDREILRFTTSPEEIGEMMMHLGRRIYGAKRQRRLLAHSFLIWVAIGFIVFLFVSALQNVGPNNFTRYFVNIALFLLGSLLAVGGTLIWLSRFQQQRLKDLLQKSPASTQVTILQSDRGLSWQTPDNSHFVSWQLFDEVSVLNKGLFLRAGLFGFVLPDRAFKTETECEDIKLLLRQCLPQPIQGRELLVPTLKQEK